MDYQPKFSLAEYTTWKIGGLADWCVQPTTIEDVQTACRWALDKDLPITVLSGGSNVLISDQGIEGLVILLDKFVGIYDTELRENKLSCLCLAGTPKSDLLKVFVKSRMSPAIFLAGLPGDVGGGVVMNAGVGHDVLPKEFVEIVNWFEFVPFNAPDTIVRRNKNDVEWTYRHCTGWGPGIITKVSIGWEEEPQADLIPRLQASNQRRMANCPT